jgi:hypothetical protein
MRPRGVGVRRQLSMITSASTQAKPCDAEAFIAEFAVEALVHAILPGLAGLEAQCRCPAQRSSTTAPWKRTPDHSTSGSGLREALIAHQLAATRSLPPPFLEVQWPRLAMHQSGQFRGDARFRRAFWVAARKCPEFLRFIKASKDRCQAEEPLSADAARAQLRRCRQCRA